MNNDNAMKNDGGEEFVPSTPPALPHHEGVAEEERDHEVETCEVNFVPLEDDFGVFSGAETDGYDVVVEDEGDVPRDDVVIEDDVRVEELEDEDEDEDEDEGRGGYLNWQKRNMDKRKIEEVYKDIDGDSGETQRFVREQRVKMARVWEEQVVEVYEGKICDLKEKLDAVSEGFMAAKRLEEHQTAEVKRLVKINLDRISDAERWRERCHRLAEINCRDERKYDTLKREKRELQRQLEMERRRTTNLELELANTRKRLLTFTRRSIPRRAPRRVIRRVDSYEDGEESSVSIERSTSNEDNDDCRVNKLIKIMDNF